MARNVNLELQRQWAWISDKLTMKQFKKTMGLRSYVDKAIMAKSVSKSKRVHRMADRLIEYWETESRKPQLELLEGDALLSRRSRANLTLIECEAV